MTKKEYCYKLADMNEEIYDIDNSLERMHLNIICEKQKMKDGESNQYEAMVAYKEELLEKKAHLEEEVRQLMREYGYLAES